MKLLGGLGVLAVLGFSQLAQAQEAPRARTGFQMALRTGLAKPLGKLGRVTPPVDGSSQDLADFTSVQVPLLVELGGKVIPNLFIGGYLGFSFGGAGGQNAELLNCSSSSITCVSATFRLGLELQYHILPREKVNPWVGYGIGIESIAVGVSQPGADVTRGYSGWELAHFMGGVDFRLTRVFGLGPFVDLSLGKYTRAHVKIEGLDEASDDIDDTRLHEWLTIGARFVFFP
jgi:hypothetical protein